MFLGHFLENGAYYSQAEDAPYVVLPVPYERSVSFGRGTGAAPAAILAASTQLELFDEELLLAPNLTVRTLPAPDCRSGDTTQIMARIEAAAAPVLAAGRFLLAIGGEHSITAPLVTAAAKMHPDMSVLHLDAHLDLRNQYQGDPLSHACAMRRVMDLSVPIVHVGIRSLCEEEYKLVNQRRLPVFWWRDLATADGDAWIKAVMDRLSDRIYISLDIDVLEPGLMPGTGTPEPGGLTWLELTHLLRQVCRRHTVIAADIVETAPIPGSQVSEYTAARLAAKLMTYHKHEGRKLRPD
ncbi:MAG: agmatinase [Kiritimatiellia bacterium]